MSANASGRPFPSGRRLCRLPRWSWPLLLALGCGLVLPLQARAAQAICSASDPKVFVEAYRNLDASVEDIRLANRSRYLAMARRSDLLLYRPYTQTATGESVPKLVYTIAILDLSGSKSAPLYLLRKDDISAEAATPGELGTDFRQTETSDPKTLLLFTPKLLQNQGYEGPPWRATRLLVVGCDANGLPQAKGQIELRRSSIGWSRFIATLACLLCYMVAATGTFHVHRRERMNTQDELPDRPRTGTNYASWWQHLNPVVLTAGSNGLGSATKLQVMFFSLLILGVLIYVWLLSGHLSEMSQTVLLLMGISGIGATASAGTELTKNRLEFENWSWLVNRRWLPKGGVAEVNIAKWKDIVTTGGEFDATRFQMITFSLLVGGALLLAGSELMDLSAFEIPTTLLGILGLSHVVYIGGKLTAPPAVSELNEQIVKLRKSESELRVALTKVNTGAFVHTTVPIVDDPDVQAATAVFVRYLADWETSKTMFEATLGRLVSESAEEMRPPFEVPELVKPTPNALADAAIDTAYSRAIEASGGVPPYSWTLVHGQLPPGLGISAQGVISGTPLARGKARFTLRVADSNNATNSREFLITTV